MRHRALVEALRLARPVPFAPGGAPGVAGPSLTALSLPTTRSAVGPPSTSRSLPLLLLSLRPASGLAGRGLACPPHGGQEASSSSKHSTPNPAAPDHDPAGDAAYHTAADDALHALLDGLEAWVDDTPGLEDADVEYSVSLLGKSGRTCAPSVSLPCIQSIHSIPSHQPHTPTSLRLLNLR